MTGILTALQEYTGLPLQLIGPDGEPLLRLGGIAHYCKLLTASVSSEQDCHALHWKSAKYARELGEAYVYSCRANLEHIAYPLLDHRNLLGCIIVGPFLMDTPDSTILSDVVKSKKLTPAMALDLYDSLSELKIIRPERVESLRRIIGYLLEPLLPGERMTMRQVRDRFDEQSRINETIQMYKEHALPENSSLYEKEAALLASMKSCDRDEVRSGLNDYIGYLIYNGAGGATLRARAAELLTLLSRTAIEGGARPDTVYSINERFLDLLLQEEKPENLSYHLQSAAESYLDSMFPTSSDNPSIREALRFIAHHYAQPLTLKEIAAPSGLSPNYFSRLFKESVGLSVHDYLNQVRVEESKKLLLTTRYSVVEIALAMGFSDESYYCRVFKKIVGLTPGKFRS